MSDLADYLSTWRRGVDMLEIVRIWRNSCWPAFALYGKMSQTCSYIQSMYTEHVHTALGGILILFDNVGHVVA